MKKIIFAALITVGSIGWAADTVNITSFHFLENTLAHSPAAELCGILITPTGKHEMVQITSDPDDAAGPGVYYVSTGKDGKFCAVIATFTGVAAAALSD